jgi:hypothetical protein
MKCKCGNDLFFIYESIVHKAETSEKDKDLTVFKTTSNEIESIHCSKCGKIYSKDDFESINF